MERIERRREGEKESMGKDALGKERERNKIKKEIER